MQQRVKQTRNVELDCKTKRSLLAKIWLTIKKVEELEGLEMTGTARNLRYPVQISCAVDLQLHYCHVIMQPHQHKVFQCKVEVQKFAMDALARVCMMHSTFPIGRDAFIACIPR